MPPTEQERFPRFHYNLDCNIDSSRQLPNWNPLEYLQDLTFLIGSLDTQVGEVPLACVIKHESGQNLVLFFFCPCAWWTTVKPNASTWDGKNTNVMFLFFVFKKVS